MIDVRRFDSLGQFRNDWLNARHHFSFGEYWDPNRMGWGALRVWNDDEIAAGQGFAPHPHQSMEIITYVRDGAITHRDSMGNEGRTAAGDVQVMSAGTGVVHSEYNREDDLTRLFQIWITPAEQGGAPSWGAAEFPKSDRAGVLTPLASGRADDRAAGALPIRQDARVLGATINAGDEVRYPLGSGRHAYVALARGSADVNGATLGPRDGAAARDEDALVIRARDDAEIVLVDTP